MQLLYIKEYFFVKCCFILAFLSISSFYGQNKNIVIEIDNSQKLIYESTLSKLRANSYKKENADMIKNHADAYFSNLQRVSDAYADIVNEKKSDLRNEIDRLMVFGENILKLLSLLQNDNLTGSNLKYTIDKANSEIQYSVTSGNLKKLIPFVALKQIRRDVFPTANDETLLIMLEKISGWSEEEIFSMHFKVENKISFRDFLIKKYEEQMITKYLNQ